MEDDLRFVGKEPIPLIPHHLRAAVLSEIHARPFTPLGVPARILHFAFDTAGSRAQTDRDNLVAFCRQRGLSAPESGERQHRIPFEAMMLRWEQHSEFTTYTWERPSSAGNAPFVPDAASLSAPMRLIAQPGPLLVAIDIHVISNDCPATSLETLFDRSSLASAETRDGAACYHTDFQLDPFGFVRILITDRGLGGERAGALAQRIIEIETYRTFALLGLPEAHRLAPSISAAERRLAELTDEMGNGGDLTDNRHMLDELTALAAAIEAGAAASVYRFGASRAYEEIVQDRLETIGERQINGVPTWSSFLARRMAPAMRTCATIEARQAGLSVKLSRAANLLRTRVDVELEHQNQELLRSMEARTRSQLRLQATVEGLSVAAVTYYVVSLFAYVAKAAHEARPTYINQHYVTAALVPLVTITIWFIVRRIHRRHFGLQ